jgi:hypothetical protein
MHQEQHRRGPGQDPKTSWRNAGAFCFFWMVVPRWRLWGDDYRYIYIDIIDDGYNID